MMWSSQGHDITFKNNKNSHKSQKLTSGRSLKPGNITILNIYSTPDP